MLKLIHSTSSESKKYTKIEICEINEFLIWFSKNLEKNDIKEIKYYF